ncbi:hypothetical protein HHI36_015064 [Cryptolaemus montrouzieri]|uniref:Uncharacterized protein n=1 Tax=Cryptolaemus montrouzieri TaxID=559131 RepID=A0ABD2N4K4_9CUCU
MGILGVIANRPHSPSLQLQLGQANGRDGAATLRESTISTKQSVPKSKSNARDSTKFGWEKKATRDNQPDSELKKKPRGAYDSAYDPKSSLLAVKWHDSSTVIVPSNYANIEPLHNGKRFSRSER